MGRQRFSCCIRRGRLGEARQHIDTLQQHLNVLAGEDNTPFLGGHKAVFHDVGHTFSGTELHDARRALEGVGRPHQGFEALGMLRITLQRQQPVVEHRGLRLRLQAE